MNEPCRYAGNRLHKCTTTFGDPANGDKMCQYEARAQLRDLERKGTNCRELIICGVTINGEEGTVVLQVPADFIVAWRASE